jgi:hypothetical protein
MANELLSFDDDKSTDTADGDVLPIRRGLSRAAAAAAAACDDDAWEGTGVRNGGGGRSRYITGGNQRGGDSRTSATGQKRAADAAAAVSVVETKLLDDAHRQPVDVCARTGTTSYH